MVRHGDEEVVLADIPGLIAGAHEGAGIGDRFLGHIERCGVLVHLVDGTLDDVVDAYETIRAELIAYGHDLAAKREILALNKCDALDAETITRKIGELHGACGRDVCAVSAVSGSGIDDLLNRVLEDVHDWRDRQSPELAELPNAMGWSP